MIIRDGVVTHLDSYPNVCIKQWKLAKKYNNVVNKVPVTVQSQACIQCAGVF